MARLLVSPAWSFTSSCRSEAFAQGRVKGDTEARVDRVELRLREALHLAPDGEVIGVAGLELHEFLQIGSFRPRPCQRRHRGARRSCRIASARGAASRARWRGYWCRRPGASRVPADRKLSPKAVSKATPRRA